MAAAEIVNIPRLVFFTVNSGIGIRADGMNRDDHCTSCMPERELGSARTEQKVIAMASRQKAGTGFGLTTIGFEEERYRTYLFFSRRKCRSGQKDDRKNSRFPGH